MKKLFAGVAALAMLLGLTIQALAAGSDSVTFKVTILSSLSVDITETELILGSVGTGTTTASATGVTVTNNGSGIDETYSLSLTDPAGWTASQTAAGTEIYVLNAAFDSDGALTWNVANHALSTVPVACTSLKFAGDQTGVSVPNGAARTLWFEFSSPTSTSVTTQQGIVITVTAQAS